MKKKQFAALFLSVTMTASIFLTSCTGPSSSKGKMVYGDAGQSKLIRGVERMADIIPEEKYKYKDYNQTAIDLNNVLFDSASQPIGTPSYIGGLFERDGKTYFGLDAYARNTKLKQEQAGEAVALMPAVLSALLAGIDKTNETWGSNSYDFVEMLDVFFNEEYGMILNNSDGVPDSEFWYMLYPQTLYAMIYNQVKDKEGYKNAEVMKKNIIRMADNYLSALPYFVDKNGNPNFEYTSFDFVNMRPVVNGQTEAPNHAIVFMLYAAYTQTGQQEYLNGMKSYMDWIQHSNKNPSYEIMTDFGPSMAALMNFKYGTNYDVEKFMNWLFDADSDSRGAWGVISDSWGDYSGDGLAGSTSDHGGYGFNMNTMHLSGTLATTAKYDPRFSTAIGKWFLNASNNARMYYPLEMPSELQSSSYMLTNDKLKGLVNSNGRSFISDPNGALAYEGVMKSFERNNISPFAVSDSWTAGLQDGHGGSPETNQLTDFCIYGSGNVGILGAAISETDVSQILQIDLNKNDAFQSESYPQFLYYNPYDTEKEIKLSFPEGSALFDINTKQVIAKVSGENTNVRIPAKGSVNIVVLPKDAKLSHTGHYYMANDVIIARDTATVSITNPDTQRLPVSGEVAMDFVTDSPERVKNMTITALTISENKETPLYSGKPIDSYKVDTGTLPNGLTNVIVSIETATGIKDQSSIKLNIYNEGTEVENLVTAWTAEEIAQFKSATDDAPGAAELAKDGWARIIMGEPAASWGSTVATTTFTVDFDKDPVVNFLIQNPTNAWCLKYRMASAATGSSDPGYWGEYLIRDNTGVGSFSINMNEVLGDNAPIGTHEIQFNLYNIGSAPDTSFEIKNLNVVYASPLKVNNIVYSEDDIAAKFISTPEGSAVVKQDGIAIVVPADDSYAEVKSPEFELDFSKNPVGTIDITHLSGKYAVRFDVADLGNEIYTFFDNPENNETGTFHFNIMDGIKKRDADLANAIAKAKQPLNVRMSVLVEGSDTPYVAVNAMDVTYDGETTPVYSVDAAKFAADFAGGNAKFDLLDKVTKLTLTDDKEQGFVTSNNIVLDFDKAIKFSIDIKAVTHSWQAKLKVGDEQPIELFDATDKDGTFTIDDLSGLLAKKGKKIKGTQEVQLLLYAEGSKQAEVEYNGFSFIYADSEIPAYQLTLDYSLKNLYVGQDFSLSATTAIPTTLEWKSSNPKAAKVDRNGKVKAVGVGTAYITAATSDGHEIAGCLVQVLPESAH